MIVNHEPNVDVKSFHCIDGGVVKPGMRVYYILRVGGGELGLGDLPVSEETSFHTSVAYFSSKEKRDQFIEDVVRLKNEN